MNYPKIGFHVAANCGGCSGIETYWQALEAAGASFVVYSANDGGLITRAAAYRQATLVYRDVEASTVNPIDYAAPPEQLAAVYWARTLARLPAAVVALRERCWLELLNEPGREPEQAAWVGGLMLAMARLALADGWRVCGPGWAPGNPEPEAWRGPAWIEYLKLCAAQPERVAVSLHEYRLSEDIHAGEGWLVGRFRFVHAAADALRVRRPTIFVTECGWTLNSLPPDEQARRDIDWLARLYGQHPNIRGAALWTLQAGAGNGQLPARLNALMPWLTRYTIETDVPGGAEQPPPPDDGEESMINLLTNGSFDDGWTDADDFPGQHPNGWSLAWNTGAAADGYQYQIGEAVHKNAALLPEAERGAFIWDGLWTYKVFAASRAIWPRLKQTVNLPGGVYRLTTPVWTDCYHWQAGKNYNLDPRHIEWQVKVNGRVVADWRQLTAGRRETPWVEFAHGGGAAELAVHLRANWPVASNNFWLDGWTLVEVESEPEPEPEPELPRHKAIVVKLPQELTAAEWQRGAEYAYGFRHTMTASHDDTLTILRGGNAESYVKLAWPSRPSQVFAAGLIEAAGYRWEPLFEVQPTPSPFDSTPTR